MKRHTAIQAFLTLVVLLIFAGCQFGLGPENEDTAVDEFVGLFDVSYELELQGSADTSASVASSGLYTTGNGISASATVPESALSSPVAVGSTGTALDYPEPGLRTDFSVAGTAYTVDGSPVLKITAVTAAMAGFEDTFLPEQTNEVYFVKDLDSGNDFDADEAGSVVHPSPSGYDWGSLYREEFADYFGDGSVRSQAIVGTKVATGLSYAAFDVNGSMDVPAAALDGNGYEPESDGSAIWSSKVVYQHPLNRTLNYWFFNASVQNPTITGVRYYTEHTNSAGQTVGTSYALEVVTGLINGNEETIAQNVIRKEVVFATGTQTAVSRTARMKMVIENQVAGEDLVVGKNGKDISRLPPPAQRAQLRHIQDSAISGVTDDWGDIETVIQ